VKIAKLWSMAIGGAPPALINGNPPQAFRRGWCRDAACRV